MIFREYFSALLIAALALVGVSCHEATNGTNSAEGTEGEEYISLTINVEDATRTALDVAVQMVRWQAGDKIVVIENDERYAVSEEAVIGDNGRAQFKATFSKDTTADTYTYDAIYPA